MKIATITYTADRTLPVQTRNLFEFARLHGYGRAELSQITHLPDGGAAVVRPAAGPNRPESGIRRCAAAEVSGHGQLLGWSVVRGV
jgi:hypothetical protein